MMVQTISVQFMLTVMSILLNPRVVYIIPNVGGAERRIIASLELLQVLWLLVLEILSSIWLPLRNGTL